MAYRQNSYTIDTGTQLKDAGLIATSARAQVSSADKILDVGAGYFSADLLLEITALEIDTGDELYDIVVQGSPDSDFGTAANIVELGAISLGPSETKRTDCDKDDTVGQYTLPFCNEHNGVLYRYVSLYVVVVGTIASGINFTAYAAKQAMVA